MCAWAVSASQDATQKPTTKMSNGWYHKTPLRRTLPYQDAWQLAMEAEALQMTQGRISRPHTGSACRTGLAPSASPFPHQIAMPVV